MIRMLHRLRSLLERRESQGGDGRRRRFHHYDMRLDNVMEHTPDPSQSAQDPISIGLVGDLEDRCEPFQPPGAALPRLWAIPTVSPRVPAGAAGPIYDPHVSLPWRRVQERTFKVIDFGLAKFDEMYAADEGADMGADMVGEDSSSSGAWYLAPLACMSSTPEAVHKAAWRGKGAPLAPRPHTDFSPSLSLLSTCRHARILWQGRLVGLQKRVDGTWLHLFPGA